MKTWAWLPTILVALLLTAGCVNHRAAAYPPGEIPNLVHVGGTGVNHGDEYPWHEGLTVLEAIKMAGGVNEWGARAVYLKKRDGTQATYSYKKLLKGQLKDPILQPGDCVEVMSPCF